jgi:hypothetical protein
VYTTWFRSVTGPECRVVAGTTIAGRG